MEFEAPSASALAGMTIDELAVVAQRVERVRRLAEAALAQVVTRVRCSGEFRADGHRSAAAWGRATCNWSLADSSRLARNGSVMAAVGIVAEVAVTGDVGVAQLDEFGRVYANPRCADQLAESAEVLVSHARGLPCSDFKTVIRRWERLADADGAHLQHVRAHEQRTAHVSIVDTEVVINATGGVLQGAEMADIFEHFAEAEFHTDWHEAAAVYGEHVNPSVLARTDAQRRFDALHAIFVTAAAAAPDVVPAHEPLVNIVADPRTVHDVLTRAAGGHAPSPAAAECAVRRCETLSGAPLDPDHLLIALLADNRCLWPGCEIPAGRCQIDHSTPWSADGPTAPSNGGVTCGHHNRFKQRGFTTRRDANGQWHTYRPDGAEVGSTRLPAPARIARVFG